MLLSCFLLSVTLQSTEYKPVPLKTGEDEDYMLALKQELRGTMQRLPHNIKAQCNKAGEEESNAWEMHRQHNWLVWVEIMQHLGADAFH